MAPPPPPAATGIWHVLTSTTLTGQRITHGLLPVTLTLNLGTNIWIVGLVDLSYLKMVKIEITGVSSYNWLETRYSTTYTTACTAQTTFVESCFSGTSPTTNSYPVDLVAELVG